MIINMEFWYHGMTEPICATSTWTKKWTGDANRQNYSYSRTRNPNFDILESKINDVYKCKASCLYPSGISAISSVFYKYVSCESVFIVGNEMYDDTYRILNHLKEKFIGFDYVTVSVTNTEELLEVYNKNKDRVNLMFFESCTNPSGQIVDFDILRTLSKHPKLNIAIDNTWLTPYVLNPFDYGVTFVVDSLTKYFGGGSVIMGTVAGSKKKIMGLRGQISVFGLHVSPFDAWSVSQMIDTLKLRIIATSNLSKKVADYLDNHKDVNRVHYPLLESHNSYERAVKFFRSENDETLGPGVIFFHMSKDRDDTIKRVNSCQHLYYATSYGKSHSMINPYIYEGDSDFYDSMNTEEQKCGVWVRLAIGWNSNFEDVCKDLNSLLC